MKQDEIIERADELYSWFPWYSELSDKISDFCQVDIYSAYSILRNLKMISDETRVEICDNIIYLSCRNRRHKMTKSELLNFCDFKS